MKLPVVSGKKVVSVLLKEGFQVARQKGSHVHLTKNASERTLQSPFPFTRTKT